MVIRSGSLLLPLAYLVTLIAGFGLLSAVGLLVARKWRLSARVAAGSVAALALYVAAANVISWVAPQTVIKLGDRGTFQTVGLVTDVEPFLRALVRELADVEAEATP